MEFIQRIFLYVSWTAFACMVFGLWKPWAMLWWEHTQNRRKVIVLYGTVAAVSLIAYWILAAI